MRVNPSQRAALVLLLRHSCKTFVIVVRSTTPRSVVSLRGDVARDSRVKWPFVRIHALKIVVGRPIRVLKAPLPGPAAPRPRGKEQVAVHRVAGDAAANNAIGSATSCP